jgi:hypothetical protein
LWSHLISLKNTFSISIIKHNKLSDAVLLLPCTTVVQAVAHYSSNGGGFKAYIARVALKAPHGALSFLLPALTGKHSLPANWKVNIGLPVFLCYGILCISLNQITSLFQQVGTGYLQ